MAPNTTYHRRRTDAEGELNVVQSVNAPVSLFQSYKDLALAQFGDSTKKQHHFRRALKEYLENHKEEFEPIMAHWRRNNR